MSLLLSTSRRAALSGTFAVGVCGKALGSQRGVALSLWFPGRALRWRRVQIIVSSARLIMGKCRYPLSNGQRARFCSVKKERIHHHTLTETLRVHCILRAAAPFRPASPQSLCHNIPTISMPITRPLVYPHKHKHPSLTFEIFRAIICSQSRPDFQVLGQEWRRGQRRSCLLSERCFMLHATIRLRVFIESNSSRDAA